VCGLWVLCSGVLLLGLCGLLVSWLLFLWFVFVGCFGVDLLWGWVCCLDVFINIYAFFLFLIEDF